MEAFVHVSTTYAFCHLPECEEKVYPMKVTPEEMMALCEKMSEQELERSVFYVAIQKLITFVQLCAKPIRGSTEQLHFRQGPGRAPGHQPEAPERTSLHCQALDSLLVL